VLSLLIPDHCHNKAVANRISHGGRYCHGGEVMDIGDIQNIGKKLWQRPHRGLKELRVADEEEGLQRRMKKVAEHLNLISKTQKFGPKAHFSFKIIKNFKI